MKPIIIANWKMYKSHNEAITWCTQHQGDLQRFTSSVTLGICPEFTAIAPIKNILQDTEVFVGAQNCSTHHNGAYTGEVPAQSLHDIGCGACIIGHSEQRAYHHETSAAVAQKMHHLLAYNIYPIVCIGETQEERDSGETQSTLTAQLSPILEALGGYMPETQTSIIIAYEPRWAIGTGHTPTNSEIESAIQTINTIIARHLDISLPILYGGSVDSSSIRQLKTIIALSGFLIGSASKDIKELQDIITALP